MSTKFLSLGVGLALGLSVVFLLGATYEHLNLSGKLSIDAGDIGLFQSAFSGITESGDCFLAITNTITGRTEIVGLTNKLREKLNDTAFQHAKEGRVVVEIAAQRIK